MTKIELIDNLEGIKDSLSDMITYLKEPYYSRDTYKNETLAKHIDIYKNDPSHMLDVMAELVRNYGDDNLHQTAIEYKQSKENNNDTKRSSKTIS